MTPPLFALPLLIRSMQPALHSGVYVFSSVPRGTDFGAIDVIAMVREDEVLSVIVSEADAKQAGWPVLFRAAWITLTVHSDLHAVGLTAVFATALANAGISCNVVAGARHDHLFVPVERAADAMAALRELARRS